MLKGCDIPVLAAATPDAVRAWYDAMLTLGCFYNPDEDPENYVHVKSGESFFDAEACARVNEAYELLIQLGDKAYEIGLEAFRAYCGRPLDSDVEALVAGEA